MQAVIVGRRPIREHVEAGQADGGAHRPRHPDGVDVQAGDHVEHHDGASQCQPGADQGEGGRPAPSGGPHPADHQHRRQIRQQQRDTDRQVRHGVVVAQLGTRDRDEPVEHDDATVRDGLAPPVAVHESGEQRHRQRAAGLPVLAAASGLQPDSMRALAKGPDMLKATAEATAKAIPTRKVVSVVIRNRHLLW